MRQKTKKTIEEHAEFLREIVKLQLWFVWRWLKKHPNEEFFFVIRNRVDIFRKTDLNKVRSKNTRTAGDLTLPEWLSLEQQARNIYEKTKDSSADMFEEQAWKVFRPVVEARVERDFHEGDGMDDYQCGSLRYDALPKRLSYRLNFLTYLTKGKPRCVNFHISNGIAPMSIFDDPEYLPNCFFQLMGETRKKFRARALTVTTWLNSYPPWLALFPKQWHDNLGPPDESVDWSQLYWGQFVTAQGTFNFKHAKIMRESGELPFKARSSWCSFVNLENHLHEYVKETANLHNNRLLAKS